jgi:hypothetical protein
MLFERLRCYVDIALYCDRLKGASRWELMEVCVVEAQLPDSNRNTVLKWQMTNSKKFSMFFLSFCIFSFSIFIENKEINWLFILKQIVCIL